MSELVPNVEIWDHVAEKYEIEISESELQIAEELLKVIQQAGIYPGASLIELGCGSGHLSAYLAMKGYKTTLLDFSQVALEKAKETYKYYKVEGEFVQGDLMKMPDMKKQYDLAWNSGVMEHFGDSELQSALQNMIAYSKNGVLFVVPNPNSVSYCLMRSRLMGDLKWQYGIEYLRTDYAEILSQMGYSDIQATYLHTAEMSGNHLLVANRGVGDTDKYYKELLKNGFLQESENYLVAYDFKVSEMEPLNIEPDSFRGNTEMKTKVFDFLSENLGLKQERELNQKRLEEQAECQRHLDELQMEKVELTRRLEEAEEELKLEKAKCLEQAVQIEQLSQQLIAMDAELGEKNAIINRALQQCTRMLDSKLFKFTHLINRTKCQGIHGSTDERRKFRKWVVSQMRGSGGDADHRYNPLFSLVSILKGKVYEDAEIKIENSPLGDHLIKEKNRLQSEKPDTAQIEKIREIISSRTYKGIMVYPHVVYWEPLQTPQQLLRAFAQNGWLCFFCEHPNIKDAFREVEDNVIIVHEREFLEAIGETEVVVLLTWLGSLSFVNELKNRRVWYHILDKLDLFPYYDTVYEQMHKKWVQNAECVSYVALPLLECLEKRSDSIYLPNGVNPEEFLNVHDSYIPEDMAGIVATGHKIIGYYGYLAEWMDYDMVRRAALSRPEYEFVFIGKSIYDTSKFDGISNIHLLGLKPYKDLSDYAKLFDVATIPFVINEKMDCVSPIKFYEYCALGLPVVTSKMREMEKYVSDFVACVDGYDEYLYHLDKFTQEATKKIAIEKAPMIAADNTWNARALLMENELNKGLDLLLTQKYNKFDVIILGVIDYDFRFQRPQHYAVRFAENGHRVFYVNANHFNPQSVTQLQENLFVVNIYNSEYSAIHLSDWKGQETELYNQLSELMNQYGVRDAVTIVDYPNWIYAAEYLRKSYGFKIITDYMDDYTGFLNPAEDLVRENCEKLLMMSDQVVASSQFLADIAMRYHEKVEIIRNGTEFNHFHQAWEKKSHQRPVVGYYGAVAEWFDCEKIIYLAENLKDCDITIVGHVTKWKKELSSYSNIKLLGEIPYKELPEYLAEFDVCLIPFDTSTDLIKATNPVKFYEYLSAGKKVVATEIPELEPFKDRYVYMSNDNEQFLNYVKLCLNNSDTLVTAEECMEFAQENDWQKRFEAFERACVNAIPKISIIVLTYNNLEINKLCVDSILNKTAYPNYELIIVDNCSKDGTRDYLKSLIGSDKRIKVILNEDNKGFAGGNNVGIAASEGDYVVLLNNDTVVTRGWLTAMSKHLENDPQLGMCGPVTNSIGNEAKIEVHYHNRKEMERFAYSYTLEHFNQEYSDVKVLALFCTMIKRSVIETCGGLDEQYGIGMFEDDDYAEAVKKAGFKLTIAEDAFIHHFESISFKKLDDEKFKMLYEENKEKFERKWNTTWKMHQKRPGITWETNADISIM